ncbi:uncharacterized protein B0I36DRAFT_395008 [Microdochium trichocladiopsis]|uniref:Uncharacterized protein n=1 Tax=Microdochium trichocladiopsis TaxID=1682393 RepID=A0A9P9BMX8_9PEZI|nr:uncharacterized protein B0I36DRAFT_395008 [Microdochium trichocladiopsis]KAH7018257.1 hypothetical protein B0I36DRAFT_395008 [Microdochium trichocladiopsis]
MKDTTTPKAAGTPRASSPTVQKPSDAAQPAPACEPESSTQKKKQETETYQRIKITSDGDAYVPLGSWARKSKATDDKSKCSNAAIEKPNVVSSKPAPSSCHNTSESPIDGEDVVIVRDGQN